MSDKWISVEVRLPADNVSVLLFRPEEGAGEDQIWPGYHTQRRGFVNDVYEKNLDGVTHWMPFPEPPSE